MQYPNTGPVAIPRLCPSRVPTSPALEGAGGRPIPRGAPSAAQYVPATQRILIRLNQPIMPAGTKLITGRLLGEMHDGPRLLHYRVDLGGNVFLLAPPEWLHPADRLRVVQAGLTVPDHLADGMFVDRINAVAAQWAAMSDQEVVARLGTRLSQLRGVASEPEDVA